MNTIQLCPNCGTCTCTGSVLTKALDGTVCCSVCVQVYNNKLRFLK